jgi:NAD(P)H-hydrate epimerase
MAAIEVNAEYLGVSRLLLMENAGRAVAIEILKRTRPKSRVAVFAGLGGNGGDGFVIARHLAAHCPVDLIVLGDPSAIKHTATAANWDVVRRMRHSIRIHIVRDEAELPEITASVVVDAVLGTGVQGSPRPPIPMALQQMNQLTGIKVAVDLPTGIHPDTGELTTKAAFRPDLTITFHRPKLGLVRGKEHIGELVVTDIGIPREAELYVGPGDVLRVYKPRHPYSRKGDFGRLLVIGGSNRYVGAPILACMGALRSGVDIVYIAAPPNVIIAATKQSPDLIPLSFSMDVLTEAALPLVQDALTQVDALLIGPGLGDNKETLETTTKILSFAAKHDKPVVIDADALKAVSSDTKLGENTIITPHAGEFRRITRKAAAPNLTRRAKQTSNLAKKIDCVVLLKGPVDIIATSQKTRYNWTGHPAMTVGGTGDVLAGVCAGLRAQGVTSFLAASVAAFINGITGLYAFTEKGPSFVASDLLDYIPQVITNPMESPVVYYSFIQVEEDY